MSLNITPSTHILESMRSQRGFGCCSQIETLIDEIAARHPTRSLAELMQLLPEPEATQLAQLLDEAALWSR